MRRKAVASAAVLLAAGTLWSPARGEPSFTCAGELSNVEVVICTTESLALLDQQLTAVYKRRFDGLAGSARTAFSKQQREWVRQRNDCALDKVCLRDAYAGRIRALEAALRQTVGSDDAQSPFRDVTRFDQPRVLDTPLDARPARRSQPDAVNVAHRFCALKGFRTMVDYRLGNAPATVAFADDAKFRNDADSRTAYRYIDCGNPR